jgi:hypothetical protein
MSLATQQDHVAQAARILRERAAAGTAGARA